MKSFFTILLLIAIFSLNLFADPISVKTANQVGQSFMARSVTTTGMLKTKKLQTNLELVYTANDLQVEVSNNMQTFVPFYVFGSEYQGYVIVAGDDRVIPILGFADEGILTRTIFLQICKSGSKVTKQKSVMQLRTILRASPEIQADWKALQSGVSLKSQTLASSVAPLITTKWDQSPYYNDQCPFR